MLRLEEKCSRAQPGRKRAKALAFAILVTQLAAPAVISAAMPDQFPAEFEREIPRRKIPTVREREPSLACKGTFCDR